MVQAEKNKLRALLEYWVKHNKEHGEEFREWAGKAENFGEPEIHDELMQAYEEMGRANVLLLNALSRLKKEERE